MNMKSEIVEFDSLVADIAIAINPIKSIVVTDQTSMRSAVDACAQIKGLIKRVEEVRVGIVSEPNEFVKTINARAREVSNPLMSIETHLKRLLGVYAAKVEQEQREERNRLEEERRRAQEQKDAELVAVGALAPDMHTEFAEKARIEREASEQSAELARKEKALENERVPGVTKRWVFEVLDKAKVPMEFLYVDRVTVNDAIRFGKRDIPGLRVFQEESVSVRSHKMPDPRKEIYCADE